MKILVSGNPNEGLAKGINQCIPGCDFRSRINGFDLCDRDCRMKFAHESLNYDAVLLVSALWQFNQTLLLGDVFSLWIKNNKTGKIIVLGSSIDKATKATEWMYPIEKKALREYCKSLGFMVHTTGIHVTYLSFGYLDTEKMAIKHPDKKKISVYQAAEYIKWVLDQPKNILVTDMNIDPVQ